MERIFQEIYSKTLKRKSELNNSNDFTKIIVKDSDIERKTWINFQQGMKKPLINGSMIHIYDKFFKNEMIKRKFPIQQGKIYQLIEFNKITHRWIQVISNGVMIDPRICKIYMTKNESFVILVSDEISNVEITILKNIYSYNLYNTNTTVNLPKKFRNSYLVIDNGYMGFIEPTPSGDDFTLSVNAQGKWMVILYSEEFFMHKVTPLDNGQYMYIPFPVEIGHVDTNNVYLYTIGENGYTHPTDVTPLYDGVKVESTDEKIMLVIAPKISRYKDLRHYYDKYHDYMDQYLNGTLPELMSSYEPHTPNIDENTSKEDFKVEMLEASKDFTNFYREYLEEHAQIQFASFIPIGIPDTNEYMLEGLRYHPNSILFFNDGLNISPYKVERSPGGRYKAYFKNTNQIPTVIHSVGLGQNISPYYEAITIDSEEITVGPSPKINPMESIQIFELVDRVLTPLSGYTYTIDNNVANLVFDQSNLGKLVYITTSRYNRLMSKGQNKSATLEIPHWGGVADKNNIHVFLDGYLQPRDRYYLFSPLEFKIMKGHAAIAVDLDTDIVSGETMSAFISSEYQVIAYNESLVDGQKIIEVADKLVPFSNKYHLVFVNGKFIHPSKIHVIDNYRFSIDADSIHNMCILRKKVRFEDKELFDSVMDKWTEYMYTLSIEDIESLIGLLNTVSDNEPRYEREVYFPERHLFEILYEYCLKGRRELTIEDHQAISEELPEILLPDGRIPISTIRSGLPRYRL